MIVILDVVAHLADTVGVIAVGVRVVRRISDVFINREVSGVVVVGVSIAGGVGSRVVLG